MASAPDGAWSIPASALRGAEQKRTARLFVVETSSMRPVILSTLSTAGPYSLVLLAPARARPASGLGPAPQGSAAGRATPANRWHQAACDEDERPGLARHAERRNAPAAIRWSSSFTMADA
jgi:hypothetical protein